MGRGRKSSVSENRVLLEILLNRDRAVFASEIAEELPVGKERVRQILKTAAAEDRVQKESVSGRNLYRLSDNGFDHLAAALRSKFD
jgi:predicted ArsR family transcriptional regulator